MNTSLRRRLLRFNEGEQGASGGQASDQQGEQNDEKSGEERTFSQEDIDKLVSKVRAEERRKASEKFSDYNDLKEKAGKAQTLEERVASMEKAGREAEVKTLRAEIASEFSLSKEDRDLLLTGTDEDTIRQQAKRLADNTADSRKRGPVAPKEGNKSKPNVSEEREAARQLFGT